SHRLRMPRLFPDFVRASGLLVIILVLASPPGAPCAELPANPLRAPLPPEPALRIMPTAVLEEPAVEPPSVVPPNLGQPELLPPPAGAYEVEGGASAPDFSNPAPWHNLVHPWFDEPWFSHSDPNDPRRHIG